MRIGIVFHKDPFRPPNSIDIVRLRAIAGGLVQAGMETEIVAPVREEGILEIGVPVRPIGALNQTGRYDLVKTSYHYSIELLGAYVGPVVSRIVRVVDERLPERDGPYRKELLRCQSLIHERARVVVLNNAENQERWHRLYGSNARTLLIPNGCPETIPPPGNNPFQPGEKVLLFLGSVAAPRMVNLLNQAARLLKGKGRIHLVGRNKAAMYGGDGDCRLDPLIVDHGERTETETWDYIQHAHAGLALAASLHVFDNDITKIFHYLRGGLPVLSEGPVLNNDLIRRTGYGKIFRAGDAADLVSRGISLMESPPIQTKARVMDTMAREYSWNRRVEAYLRLFESISPKGGETW